MPKKSVPITLADGKTRQLRFDYNALCSLEDEFHISLGDLWKKLAGSVSVSLIRGLIWAGLLHAEEGLTVKQVGNLIDIERLGEYSTIVAEAFTASFNVEGEPKNAARPEPAQSGTGENT